MKRNVNIIKYSILILLFIISVFLIVYIYLEINKYKGQSTIRNTYYDVNFYNVFIDYNTSSNIIPDNENKIISFNINDLQTYRNENSINIELYNIGSIDAQISNIVINNIETLGNVEDMIITLSVETATIIKARSKMILKVDLNYIGENIENNYYNFNISFSFKDVEK